MSFETKNNVTSIDKHLYDETSKVERLRRLKRTGIVLAGIALSTLAVMGLERDNSQEAEKRAEYEKAVIDHAEQGGGTFIIDGKEITIKQAEADVSAEVSDVRNEPVRGAEVDNYVDEDELSAENVILHNPIVVTDANNPANDPFVGAQDTEGNWYWTGGQELEAKNVTYVVEHVDTTSAVLETVK